MEPDKIPEIVFPEQEMKVSDAEARKSQVEKMEPHRINIKETVQTGIEDSIKNIDTWVSTASYVTLVVAWKYISTGIWLEGGIFSVICILLCIAKQKLGEGPIVTYVKNVSKEDIMETITGKRKS